MDRKLVNAICRTFPGAEVSDPWGGGHDAWKVGGKMFACIGAVMPGVSAKTDSVETAELLIDAGVAVRAPYFHRSWVNLPWGTAEDAPRYLLAASHKLVRSSLTKKAQALFVHASRCKSVIRARSNGVGRPRELVAPDSCNIFANA